MMNGRNSLRDIQADFFRRTAELLPMEALEHLVGQLDEQHFLDSPSFRLYYESLVTDFRLRPSRPARHAGSAYESGEGALRSQLDACFTHPEGPGPVERPASGSPPLRGLVAPHIDVHRGGPAYAHAYKTLAEHPGAGRFVIFGTCHNPMARRFALTEKDFETPLGPAATDRNFVRRLAGRLAADYFEDEFAHRGEHSIEFQAVFLQHVLGGRRDFKIIPVLVGSFQDLWVTGGSPAGDPEVGAMVRAVRETAAESPGGVCVIAGADLAHVGRHFGDPSGPTDASLRMVAQEDQKFLERVRNGAAEDAFRFIAAERDCRRVCGYPPIYMTLRSIDRPRGELLAYRQWADLQAGAAVTFASLALY
jgi:AmmeMemoRadiSam system protein B